MEINKSLDVLTLWDKTDLHPGHDQSKERLKKKKNKCPGSVLNSKWRKINILNWESFLDEKQNVFFFTIKVHSFCFWNLFLYKITDAEIWIFFVKLFSEMLGKLLFSSLVRLGQTLCVLVLLSSGQNSVP